jgi:hypothetical protein
MYLSRSKPNSIETCSVVSTTKNADKRTGKHSKLGDSVKRIHNKRNIFSRESYDMTDKLLRKSGRNTDQVFDNCSLSAIHTAGVRVIDFYPPIRFHLTKLQKRRSSSAWLTM